MKTTRHFFISNDLDDLERLEEDLEREGVVTPQIHVLTQDETSADNHIHLHKVVSLMKKDVVHSTLVGAAVGVVLGIIGSIVAYVAGWTDTAAGWVPFIFLAIITLGFCTWEGGLRGIETPNAHFQRFEDALEAGRHVFFVDLEPKQGKILQDMIKKHPTVEAAGTSAGAPRWIVMSQHRLKRFFTETFP